MKEMLQWKKLGERQAAKRISKSLDDPQDKRKEVRFEDSSGASLETT
jgi:hypothetical protein